ncbi:hypothetical protein DIZ27_41965 [Streptomyces sp. NWU339]|uniref:hypothetical protein n=1 Tax=Streptomyces sp. NWU339 TaxID=2185284 RepID=UPI000D6800D6|nr:hypothetical protein [Streptomyces sp. NWU339]PWI04991.1 hypothetical protein DIZ27_41965 [Streptomyces sp. NWU339]
MGRIEWDRAGLMRPRHGDDYVRLADDVWRKAVQDKGEETSTSRYPLLYPPDAWDVMSMLELRLSGIEYRKKQDGDTRTVWLLHGDRPPRAASRAPEWPPGPSGLELAGGESVLGGCRAGGELARYWLDEGPP